MARTRYRPGLPGGRPARRGEDQWQDTQREYESRVKTPAPYWHAITTTAQTVTAGTLTQVVFTDAEFTSSGVIIDSGGVYISQPGIYNIQASAGFNGLLDTESQRTVIQRTREGTTEIVCLARASHGATTNGIVHTGRLIVAERGDIFTLWCSYNGAGTHDTMVSEPAVHFEGFRIA